jgi:hypothetical protein
MPGFLGGNLNPSPGEISHADHDVWFEDDFDCVVGHGQVVSGHGT